MVTIVKTNEAEDGRDKTANKEMVRKKTNIKKEAEARKNILRREYVTSSRRLSSRRENGVRSWQRRQ